MASLIINQGAASAAPAFDAPAWLAAWADHGGVAMLAGDRLFVGRLAGIDRQAAHTLDSLRSAIHQPGAGEAITATLRLRSFGEVAHG